jgi:hypothetical protein
MLPVSTNTVVSNSPTKWFYYPFLLFLRWILELSIPRQQMNVDNWWNDTDREIVKYSENISPYIICTLLSKYKNKNFIVNQ